MTGHLRHMLAGFNERSANLVVHFRSALYGEEVRRGMPLLNQRTCLPLDNHPNSQDHSNQLLFLRVRFSLMCSISSAFVCISLLIPFH